MREVSQEPPPHQAWGDYDRDELDDYLEVKPSADTRLMRNVGDGSFEDVTALVGLNGLSACRSAAWGDFDRDGWVDLYVALSDGRSCLFRSLEGTYFQDRTREAGLSQVTNQHNARWFDYDKDGYLDLVLQGTTGDLLLHNRGEGTFEGVPLPGVNVMVPRPAESLDHAQSGSPGEGEAPASALLWHFPTEFSIYLPFLAERGANDWGIPGSMMPVNGGSGCIDSIYDATGLGICFKASSVPRIRQLYPITGYRYVSPVGRVGIGTTSPEQQLSVAGVIESTSGGVKFPDGSLQAGAASGGVPSSYMILSDTAVAPPGYAFTGGSVGVSLPSWTPKGPMAADRRRLGAAALNGRIYAIGGVRDGIGGGQVGIVEEYDPLANTWTFKAAMPTPSGSLGVTEASGRIYAIGGVGNLSVVQEYNACANTWSTKTSMPSGRYDLSAVAVNGKIYAIGGSNLAFPLRTMEEYDPATDSWSTKASMPTARVEMAAAAVNGKIYVIGGIGASGYLSVVEEYDPATNTWNTKAPMPTARGGLAAAALDGIVYVIGGMHGPAALNTMEEYDPALNRWSEAVPMPTARYTLAVAASGGRIYAMGGYDGQLNSSAVEEVKANQCLYVHARD